MKPFIFLTAWRNFPVGAAAEYHELIKQDAADMIYFEDREAVIQRAVGLIASRGAEDIGVPQAAPKRRRRLGAGPCEMDWRGGSDSRFCTVCFTTFPT